MGRVHSTRASVGRGTSGACKLSTRLPQSEFPSERNLFELGLYEEPRTPLWLSQRQTLERLRHGDPGCGDDRRHEDFGFADADEVDAIAAKMTSLSVGDSSLTSLERTWPRQRSLGRAARDLNPGRRTKTRQLSLEVLVRDLLDDNDGRCYMATHNITQHGAEEWESLIAPDVIPPTVACGGIFSLLWFMWAGCVHGCVTVRFWPVLALPQQVILRR